MKKLHLSIGNRRGSVHLYHLCEGDLAEKALELKDGDESQIREFIKDNFEDDVWIEHCVIPTADEEEEGPTSVVAEDEEGEVVFDDEVDTEWMYSVHGNPKDWRCDESVPDEIKMKIEEWTAKYPETVAELVASGDLRESDVDDPDAVGEAVESCTSDGGLTFDCCPELKPGVYAVEHYETYGISFDGDIDLEDGEEFDPDKLDVWVWDNDWTMYQSEGMRNCVMPLIRYGGTFYMLGLEEWSAHYSSFEIVKVG